MTDQFTSLEKSIIEGNAESGVTESLKLVEGGKKPIQIFTECIEPVLAEIGDQFSRLEIFLPEMINAAEVVKAIQEALKPYLEADQTSASKGKVVIATVSGDMHDIGKNIVKAMLEVNGFEIKDLGVDVSPKSILSSAKEFDANIIALSALMLPSLPFVKDVIDFVNADEATRERFKIIVGGGPVSRDWAVEAGADGYGDNAIDAVAIVRQLLSA
jgi:methylmalonyl-CoA mutase cobalamin-binding domain/chain